MTHDEWLECVQWMLANWPHADIPDVTIAVWYEDVQDIEVGAVRAALRTMADEQFPRSGAAIRARVVELGRDDPDYGEAWKLVQKAQIKGLHREHDQAGTLEWLEQQSPMVAEAVRRFGPDSLATYDLADEFAVRAQFRDIFRGCVRDAQDGDRFRGLPTAGLRRLERGPKRFGDVIGEISEVSDEDGTVPA